MIIDREKEAETETERTRKAKVSSMNFHSCWVLVSCDIGEEIVCQFPQMEEEGEAAAAGEGEEEEEESEVGDKRMCVGGEGDGETLRRQTRRQRQVMRILVLGVRV